MDAADLQFEVNWIGFWFNIPGFTLDPTQVANTFFDGGADVVVSGIDTTEALVVAGQRADAGEGCLRREAGSLPGRALLQLGPGLPPHRRVGARRQLRSGVGVVRPRLGRPEQHRHQRRRVPGRRRTVGRQRGHAGPATLDQFIAGLADGSINLFTGPLNYQDDTPYLGDGEAASDFQLWYTEQLLEGMIGASAPS